MWTCMHVRLLFFLLWRMYYLRDFCPKQLLFIFANKLVFIVIVTEMHTENI